MTKAKKLSIAILSNISNILLLLLLFYFLTGESRFVLKNPYPSLAVSLFITLVTLYFLGSKEAVTKTWTFRLFRWILEKSANLICEKPILFVTILSIIYATLYVIIGILRYTNYHALICDIGILYQSLWNTLHGEFLISSVKGGINRFTDHVEPIVFIFLPLIKVFASPLVLVIFQNIALFLAIYPLYMISKIWVKSPYLLTAILFSYVAFMPLKSVALSDYHSISLFVPLFFFALYFLDSKKYVLYFLFIFLCALCKEVIGIKLLFFGLAIAIFRKQQRLVGISTAIFGIIQLYVAFGLVMPSLSGPYLHFSLYSHLGSSPLEIVLSPFTKPKIFWGEIFNADALKYLLLTLAPFLFLPLFEPISLIPLVVMYAQLVFAEGSQAIHLGHHHAAEFLPFSFYGLILMLAKLEKMWGLDEKRAKSIAMCLLFASALFYEKPEMYLLRKFIKPATPDIELINEAIRTYIPPDASVAANGCIAAHMANRHHIYNLYAFQKFMPDYVVLHESLCPWPLKKEGLKKFPNELEATGYELVFKKGDLSVYCRTK